MGRQRKKSIMDLSPHGSHKMKRLNKTEREEKREKDQGGSHKTTGRRKWDERGGGEEIRIDPRFLLKKIKTHKQMATHRGGHLLRKKVRAETARTKT